MEREPEKHSHEGDFAEGIEETARHPEDTKGDFEEGVEEREQIEIRRRQPRAVPRRRRLSVVAARLVPRLGRGGRQSGLTSRKQSEQ